MELRLTTNIQRVIFGLDFDYRGVLMSRICELSGVGVLSGHKVSHSEIKTKRRFKPNLHTVQFASNLTNQLYRLRVTTRCISSIDKAGGFDKYMLKVKNNVLSLRAKKIQKQIRALHQNLKAE